MNLPVRVGLIGSQFISTIHAESLQKCPQAVLSAVASPTPGNAEKLAKHFGIPKAYLNYRQMLANPDIQMVVVGAPNDLHCQIVVDAAAAGKHVVIEKPLCLNLGEADQMIAACRKAGVKLMYAEELCFAPKYVRLKQLLDSGALGQPTLLKQSEKHDGPHAAHFWDVNRSGGGVTMDMGCHAIEFFRWMLGRPAIKSVYAHMSTQVHGEKTQGDDNSILILEFVSGVIAVAEESWTKLGGMDDRAEVHGSRGVAYADLLHGNAIETYSAQGYDYAVEKAGSTKSDDVIDALIGVSVPNLTGGFSTMMPNHHITKPVLIGEIQGDGQFEVVWKTPGLVVGDEWSDFLPDSKDLISDWRKPMSCGNFNTKTGKCGGKGS